MPSGQNLRSGFEYNIRISETFLFVSILSLIGPRAEGVEKSSSYRRRRQRERRKRRWKSGGIRRIGDGRGGGRGESRGGALGKGKNEGLWLKSSRLFVAAFMAMVAANDTGMGTLENEQKKS